MDSKTYEKEINLTDSSDKLSQLEVKYLGRNGVINDLLKKIKDIPSDEKKDYGQKVNKLKTSIKRLIEVKKKELASRTFKVGKERIIFLNSRLNDIKEAITKQDLRDLQQDGAILIKEIKGRKKRLRKKKKRTTGNVRKMVKTRKQDYVKLTRKLRKYIKELRKNGKLSLIEFRDIRKKIRNKNFKSESQLKIYLKGLRK